MTRETHYQPQVFTRSWIVALASLSLVATTQLRAQGDACTRATVIEEGTVNGSTATASSDGSASCGKSSSSPDQWFSFTAPAAGLATISTCGSGFDTVLSLHRSCPGGTGSELTCNDDSCDVQSVVSASLSAGETVLIRVSGYDGDRGSYSLIVTFNDAGQGATCEDVRVLAAGDTLRGTTTGRSSSGSASCGSSGNSPDCWFRHDAAEDCLLVASACESDFDTNPTVSIESEIEPDLHNPNVADNVKCGNSFSDDGLPDIRADYLISNPPFGVDSPFRHMSASGLSSSSVPASCRGGPRRGSGTRCRPGGLRSPNAT